MPVDVPVEKTDKNTYLSRAATFFTTLFCRPLILITNLLTLSIYNNFNLLLVFPAETWIADGEPANKQQQGR